MDVVTWWVIVPLTLASLVTGVLQALGTPWGLLRHYWVAAKLVLTVLATGFLLLHTGPLGLLADSADAGGALEGPSTDCGSSSWPTPPQLSSSWPWSPSCPWSSHADSPRTAGGRAAGGGRRRSDPGRGRRGCGG